MSLVFSPLSGPCSSVGLVSQFLFFVKRENMLLAGVGLYVFWAIKFCYTLLSCVSFRLSLLTPRNVDVQVCLLHTPLTSPSAFKHNFHSLFSRCSPPTLCFQCFYLSARQMRCFNLLKLLGNAKPEGRKTSSHITNLLRNHKYSISEF